MTAPETASVTHQELPAAVRPPVSRAVLVLVLLVIALSAAVRVVDLGRFQGTVYDEYYYVHDARALLHGGLAGASGESWRPAGVRSVAHPDLAKLAIAAGIVVLGDDPWGWRVPAALAGIALVALVFPLARRLGLTDEWALAALVLAAADPMLMLESRVAVLDMFVALGTALSVYLALRYVQEGFRLRWLVASRPRSAPPWPASGPASSPSPRCCSSSCLRSCADVARGVRSRPWGCSCSSRSASTC